MVMAWSNSFETVVVVDAVTDGFGSVDPLVLSLLVLGLVALVVGGWGVFWWLLRPPGVRLKRVLAKEDAVTLLMHPNPDPDAMSSAMGIAAIADSVDTDTTIQYPGEIRHQEN